MVDVTMPQMGVSVAEGTVVEWRKQRGDWVEADETICEISTDKIDTEVPAPASGRLVEVLVDVGVTVNVGVTLARIATDARPGEPHSSENGAPQPGAVEPASAPGRAELHTPARSAPARRAAPAGGGRSAARRYSPVVQRIADEHGVDLDEVVGTGRDGRVQKTDVMAVVAARGGGTGATRSPDADTSEPTLHIESPYRPGAGVSTDGPYTPPEGRPLSRMRQAIGVHMKQSQMTAATCTTWIEVDVSRIELARKKLAITALPLIARWTAPSQRASSRPSRSAWRATRPERRQRRGR
jgi:2-oxoglutarate dehydrogenase E2 component (dihydrolipoamide succinyltransferase)